MVGFVPGASFAGHQCEAHPRVPAKSHCGVNSGRRRLRVCEARRRCCLAPCPLRESLIAIALQSARSFSLCVSSATSTLACYLLRTSLVALLHRNSRDCLRDRGGRFISISDTRRTSQHISCARGL